MDGNILLFVINRFVDLFFLIVRRLCSPGVSCLRTVCAGPVDHVQTGFLHEVLSARAGGATKSDKGQVNDNLHSIPVIFR